MKWIIFLACLSVLVAADGEVLVLTDENFEATINGGKPVLVKFYAPWCGHCKKMAPEYVKLAEDVKKNNEDYIIAEMDATEHKTTAAKYSVQGFPTIKLFINGSPIDYSGERKVEDFLAFIRRKTQPASIELKSLDEIKARAEGLGRRCILISDDNKDLQAYMNTGRSMEQFEFFHTSEKLGREFFPEVKKACVVILRDFDKNNIIYEDSFEPEKFLPFLKNHKYDVVVLVDKETIGELFEEGQKKGVMLLGGPTIEEEIKKTFRALAESKKSDEFLFMMVTTNDEWGQRLIEYFSLDAAELPVVEILDGRSGEPLRYRHTGKLELTELEDFLERYRKGEIKKFTKSQPIPKDNPGPVYKVVGSNFKQEVIDNDHDVFVKFYAEWCGHCKKLIPIYAALAESLKASTKIKLVEIDATKNDVEGVSIKSFPTLYLFPAGKKDSPIKYEGERTEEGFMKFLKEKCTNPFDPPKNDL